MTTTAKCQFCGAPSSLLCDGRVWDTPRGPYRVPGNFINGKTRSCDAPVCRTCAKKIGDVHLHMRGVCRWDTRDLCPECQKVTDKPIPMDPQTNADGAPSSPEVTPE